MDTWSLKLDVEVLARFIDDAFPKAARPALGRLAALSPGHARLTLDPEAAADLILQQVEAWGYALPDAASDAATPPPA